MIFPANAMKGEAEKCREVGMDDYLSKPISRKKVIGTLASWMERHKIESSCAKNSSDEERFNQSFFSRKSNNDAFSFSNHFMGEMRLVSTIQQGDFLSLRKSVGLITVLQMSDTRTSF